METDTFIALLEKKYMDSRIDINFYTLPFHTSHSPVALQGVFRIVLTSKPEIRMI